jgi:hypothetical protein
VIDMMIIDTVHCIQIRQDKTIRENKAAIELYACYYNDRSGEVYNGRLINVSSMGLEQWFGVSSTLPCDLDTHGKLKIVSMDFETNLME